MRLPRSGLLLAPLIGLAAACSPSVGTAPTSVGRSVPLRVGQEYVPVPGGALGVSLLSVDEDSRCPASVQCVWSGSATITLGVRLGMGPTVPTPLTWNAPAGSRVADSTIAGGFRVRFDSLAPWPATPGPRLPVERYTAWLTFRPLTP